MRGKLIDLITHKAIAHAKSLTTWLLLAAIFSLCLITYWVIDCAFDGAANWVNSISDPTERGFAYIAVAIVVHAFIGGDRTTVKVEKD